MKTNYLKFAMCALVGMLCLAVTPASARKARHHKRVHRSSKLPASELSNMKLKNVEFAFNSAAVPEKDYPNLDKVAKLMADNSASVKVDGYADSKGGYVYNWKLSKVRADAVKAYLVSKGADSARIAATEFGYTHPIASNKTPLGRKKNRRVEVKFAQ